MSGVSFSIPFSSWSAPKKPAPRLNKPWRHCFSCAGYGNSYLSSLGSPENQLPQKLRADLISVGIGLLKEADAIRRGESTDFASLKEISQTIADGLM